MNESRDSRTAEERERAEDREREFHRKRHEAGLPPLNYEVAFTLSFRDVTDAEAGVIDRALADAAFGVLDGMDAERDRPPSFSSSTHKIERNIHAVPGGPGG